MYFVIIYFQVWIQSLGTFRQARLPPREDDIRLCPWPGDTWPSCTAPACMLFLTLPAPSPGCFYPPCSPSPDFTACICLERCFPRCHWPPVVRGDPACLALSQPVAAAHSKIHTLHSFCLPCCSCRDHIHLVLNRYVRKRDVKGGRGG